MRARSLHKRPLQVIAVLVSISLAGLPAVAEDFFVFDAWGSTYFDAEKTGNDDGNMCWAAAASNVLRWTTWASPESGFVTEYDVFGYLKEHWTNDGGWPGYAWSWWFDGVNLRQGQPNWSQVEWPGGAFWPEQNLDDYYRSELDPARTPSFIRQSLENGYGVTLGLQGPTWHAGGPLRCRGEHRGRVSNGFG